MTTIMQMAAELFPSGPLSRKNSGTPISAPAAETDKLALSEVE